MLPHKHALLSAAVGVTGWWVTGEPAMVGAALIGGVLPDVDHLVDYLYYYRYKEHRLILLFHGYEYVIGGAAIALAASNSILGLAIASYLLHLLADQLENRTHWGAYSVLFRAWHQFQLESLSTVPVDAAQGRMDDLRRLKRLFQFIQWGEDRRV